VSFTMIRQQIPVLRFLDARRTWREDEMRRVRQGARAILSGEADRRAASLREAFDARHQPKPKTSVAWRCLLRITNSTRTSRHVRDVPILLQKSQEAERLISRQVTKQATVDDQ
jgi:hypothetical protein